MPIGEYIKALREQHHWTLRELGEAAGQLSIGFLSDIERGRPIRRWRRFSGSRKPSGWARAISLVGAGCSTHPINLPVLADRTVRISVHMDGNLIKAEVEKTSGDRHETE